MTSKRKSKRKGRKNVNYTDMSSNCESDDDFEVDFEPQTKKAKRKEKEMNKEKKGERRPSVREKLYQRDIEKAIEMSLISTPCDRKDNDVGQKESSHIKINSEGIDDDARDTSDARDTCDKSSAKVNKIHDNDVESDSNEEKIVNLKNGKKMSGGSHMFSESSDYKCTPVVGTKEKKSSPINSSKENFEYSKNEGKISTFSCVGTKEKKSSPINSSKENVKHLKNEGKISSFSCVGTKEKMSSPINSSKESVKHMKNEGTISTFSSPKLFTNKTSGSFCIGSVKIKNSGPPLRVGLSRNHKVKPLHNKVTLSQ